MEVREEYRGKIRYLCDAEPEQGLESDWIMGIIIAEKGGGQMHCEAPYLVSPTIACQEGRYGPLAFPASAWAFNLDEPPTFL